MSASWKLTLACTRDEAAAIAAAEIDGAALVTTEEDEGEGRWRLDAYFDGAPDDDALAAVRALVAAPGDAAPAPLADEDWTALSQAGLEPITEGRFVVHIPSRPVAPPPGGRAFAIDAGRAFGTGHHATTAGCLAALDAMRGPYRRIVDLGTGTGLLAFAARHRWPEAAVTATDIDPVAIEVTRENAALNRADDVRLIVADGARGETVAAGAPYDLVIANILAGPLVAMASEIVAVAAPDATILLAGLLDRQRAQVIDAYAACGCALVEVDVRDDWAILQLTAGVPATAIDAADPAGRDDWAHDR